MWALITSTLVRRIQKIIKLIPKSKAMFTDAFGSEAMRDTWESRLCDDSYGEVKQVDFYNELYKLVSIVLECEC